MIVRLSFLFIFASMVAAVMAKWNATVGFDPRDVQWWAWLAKTVMHSGGLPKTMTLPIYWSAMAGAAVMGGVMVFAARVRNRTLAGERGVHELHGSARWARRADIRRAGLFSRKGVVVGGWRRWFRLRPLRHDGPEHVMAFAPTRSGKGVSLILPTLLSWRESCLVFDIKGENYALTAGWRAQQGQKVIRFEPASPRSARFNPLAEVRVGSGRDIADCQRIAAMIIDPDGKGLEDYWRKEGWGWLSTILLHVIYRIRKENGRCASLRDVNLFASGTGGADSEDESGFVALLDDMIAYEHGESYVDEEVRRGAARMKVKAHPERSGVHSSAITELALYADPVVAKNTSRSDFSLDALMNGEKPLSLYLVIQPADIDRLRPLFRILMNQLLRRLMEEMRFTDGRNAAFRRRLLLMLDEFTAVGKLEIFERALAFMAGYGIRAFVVVQDITQLRQTYGRDESIMANCHVRIAFAPNQIETARVLSDLTGRSTIVQERRSRSGRMGERGSLSESVQETGRPLLTADECMRLRMLSRRGKRTRPGDTLIFMAGAPVILGRQWLYFLNKDYARRARIPPPQSDDERKGR